jgi:hypothetical protein
MRVGSGPEEICLVGPLAEGVVPNSDVIERNINPRIEKIPENLVSICTKNLEVFR